MPLYVLTGNLTLSRILFSDAYIQITYALFKLGAILVRPKPLIEHADLTF